MIQQQLIHLVNNFLQLCRSSFHTKKLCYRFFATWDRRYPQPWQISRCQVDVRGIFGGKTISAKTSKCWNFLVFCSTVATYLTDCSVIQQNAVQCRCRQFPQRIHCWSCTVCNVMNAFCFQSNSYPVLFANWFLNHPFGNKRVPCISVFFSLFNFS